ncbi:maleylpyruvate isomerase N-terminal domain-containing protein [Mycobacterium interjectum]|uniref:maleylpyruvate isomerase N-terminal domain-containing protein n=1 Tax=Mycobacterium interjectum TaxID=33895 RepID=UPI0008349210|nr:maleylpyruvate isomerase N-terminal domain-containing protein [Mycobacterium interjectum]MCV7093027.1 maleylpyruvate isomerase N-terminal domain-containing protein [Mycobacterium interjectum]
MSDTDERAVLTEAARYLLQNLLLVREADLAAPTPCREWDLRRLLHHICASLAEVATLLAARDFGEGTRPAAGSDPAGAVRAAIVDLVLAARVHKSAPAFAGRWCEIQGRTLAAKTVVHVGAIEMAVHAWDIAQACRIDRPIPSGVASALLWVSPPLARAGLAGHVFAEPLPAPPTATASEQLLALFGRRRAPR